MKRIILIDNTEGILTVIDKDHLQYLKVVAQFSFDEALTVDAIESVYHEDFTPTPTLLLEYSDPLAEFGPIIKSTT